MGEVLRMVSDPPGRRAGFFASPEPVVHDCLGPLEYGNPDSFATPRHLDTTTIDQRDSLSLAAAQSRESHRAAGLGRSLASAPWRLGREDPADNRT